jgi:hypothetical protein
MWDEISTKGHCSTKEERLRKKPLVIPGPQESARELSHHSQNCGPVRKYAVSGEITLMGEGSPARWTRRALERSGYRVTPFGRLWLTATNLQDRFVWELANVARHEERTRLKRLSHFSNLHISSRAYRSR